MYEKKIAAIVSPDLKQLQAVIIDGRTTIFIDKGSNPDDARRLYEQRRQALNIKLKWSDPGFSPSRDAVGLSFIARSAVQKSFKSNIQFNQQD